MSDQPTMEVPIEMVRTLLTGVLSGTCMYAVISHGELRRVCIVHRSVAPCVAQEMMKVYAADEAAIEEYMRSEREDWIASPEGDTP